MAKQISQSTFDEAVRENIDEFEMSSEDAVEDAIKQFESQGVNLNIIVKDPSLYSACGGGEHKVVAAIKHLTDLLKNPFDSTLDILESLRILKSECDIDLARRCLAGKNNAFPVLVSAIKTFESSSSTLSNVLDTICSLVNGQPDLLDQEGAETLISLLKNDQQECDIIEPTIKAIKLNCIKHEKNRNVFIELDLILILTDMLKNYKDKPQIIKESCACLRSLTVDDDIRVPFGKAHENAKTIVTQGDAFEDILCLCQEYANNSSVISELFTTLGSLAVRNEFCKEVMDKGGLNLIIAAFRGAISEKNIARQALFVLKCLAGNDEVKIEIRKLGGIELVISAMENHETVAGVIDTACLVLTAISLRNDENCRKIVELQGHQSIVQAMKLHPENASVQKHASMALRNLVSHTKELSENILALGVESLLNETMQRHKDAADEAKAALRDLGCKVELRELWKGENGTIQ